MTTARQQAQTRAVSRLRSVARKSRVQIRRHRYGTGEDLGAVSYPSIAEIAVGAAADVYEPILVERDETIRKLIGALQYRWMYAVPMGRTARDEFHVVQDAQILIGDMEPLEVIRARYK